MWKRVERGKSRGVEKVHTVEGFVKKELHF